MDEKKVIDTNLYKLPHFSYFAIIIRDLLRIWWSIPTLLAVILLIATCYDLRFGIVFLLLLFVIFPLSVFFLYYNYALRPECFYSVAEKRVIIHRKGIDCEYGDKIRKILEWKSVRRIVVVREAFLFYTGQYTFFYLPFSAFKSIDELQIFSEEWISCLSTENQGKTDCK